jgi:ribonuclease P protein component
VAYAVGRGVGTAVTRNRVRRRLRAAVHAEADALRADHVYLVRALPGAEHVGYDEVRRAVRALLDQLAAAE